MNRKVEEDDEGPYCDPIGVWCYGGPGRGKTTVCHHILESVKRGSLYFLTSGKSGGFACADEIAASMIAYQ